MSTRIRIAAALLAAIVLAPVAAQASLPAGTPDGLYAVMTTSKGVVIMELLPDSAPLTVQSFVGLAEGLFLPDGKPYFDGIVFHRVEPGFVVQGGDPTGTGTGGPGYQFPNEIDPALKYSAAGVVGMANAGPDTNGSQFFITLGAADFLNGGYSIFGRVVSGMQVVTSIVKGDTIVSMRIVRKGAKASTFKPNRTAFDAAVAAAKTTSAERAAASSRAAIEPQMATIQARWTGLVAGKNGLMYRVLKPGNGTKPAAKSTVKVLYTLTNADGTVLDSTASRGNTPFSFVVGNGQVIPGFDLSVLDMSYGEKRVVVVPPELGYGTKGVRGAIPANAVLVFEIELLLP